MRKYIATHVRNNITYAKAFIIPNHYGHSLSSFNELVAEARKTFPELKDEDIELRTVSESGWCKHCPVVTFSVPGDTVSEENMPEGWTHTNHGSLDIYL